MAGEKITKSMTDERYGLRSAAAGDDVSATRFEGAKG